MIQICITNHDCFVLGGYDKGYKMRKTSLHKNVSPGFTKVTKGLTKWLLMWPSMTLRYIMGYFIILERLDSKQKSLFINMKIQI